MKKVFMVCLVVLSFISCSKDDGYEATVNERLDFVIPANFPAPAQAIEHNYPTQKGFELGRKLFYDAKLSANNTISCSFCHEQESAFTHHGHTFSHGIYDQEGTRNAPAIQNMAFQSQYFYDGASSTIDMLSIAPIHNPVEMDETLENIAEKLKQDAEYVKLFNQAFEGGNITSGNILKALGQFMTMMVSANSKYDKFVRSELPGNNFTEKEMQGLELFRQKCASCHATDVFTDSSFRNNGLPPNPNLNDLGRETVTGFERDRYKFKVPSLRNVELTAPYMHDGRFGSLESVLNFYSSGMTDSETLDEQFKTEDGTLGIPLTDEEKEALIAFLKTLTDEEYINNPLFYYQT